MRKIVIIITILIAYAFGANAQLQNPYMIIYKPIKYDSVMSFLQDSSAYFEAGQDDAYRQSLGTLYSFLGDYEKAKHEFVLADTKKGYIPDVKTKLNLTGCEVNQEQLNSLYSDYNVVLFNEAHHVPQHRAFLYSQLEALKRLGFNQLALEALNENDTLIALRKYPVSNFPTLITGVYTNDPIYGNLIRKALTLGFELIAYDNGELRRDKNQAKNICEQYDEKKGKLVVLGGYGHIEQKFPFMGYHLQKQIDEEILSISQTTPHSIQPLFPENTNHDIFIHKDTSGSFDYCLYFNGELSESNIPYWYAWMDYKTIKLSDLLKEDIAVNSLIQLYAKGEINGVPIFQYWNATKEATYIAYPESGAYLLKISNESEVIQKDVVL